MFTVLHKWDNYNAHSMDLVAKYLYQYFDTQTTEKLCLLFNMLENNPSNDPNHSRWEADDRWIVHAEDVAEIEWPGEKRLKRKHHQITQPHDATHDSIHAHPPPQEEDEKRTKAKRWDTFSKFLARIGFLKSSSKKSMAWVCSWNDTSGVFNRSKLVGAAQGSSSLPSLPSPSPSPSPHPSSTPSYPSSTSPHPSSQYSSSSSPYPSSSPSTYPASSSLYPSSPSAYPTATPSPSSHSVATPSPIITIPSTPISPISQVPLSPSPHSPSPYISSTPTYPPSARAQDYPSQYSTYAPPSPPSHSFPSLSSASDGVSITFQGDSIPFTLHSPPTSFPPPTNPPTLSTTPQYHSYTPTLQSSSSSSSHTTSSMEHTDPPPLSHNYIDPFPQDPHENSTYAPLSNSAEKVAPSYPPSVLLSSYFRDIQESPYEYYDNRGCVHVVNPVSILSNILKYLRVRVHRNWENFSFTQRARVEANKQLIETVKECSWEHVLTRIPVIKIAEGGSITSQIRKQFPPGRSWESEEYKSILLAVLSAPINQHVILRQRNLKFKNEKIQLKEVKRETSKGEFRLWSHIEPDTQLAFPPALPSITRAWKYKDSFVHVATGLNLDSITNIKYGNRTLKFVKSKTVMVILTPDEEELDTARLMKGIKHVGHNEYPIVPQIVNVNLISEAPKEGTILFGSYLKYVESLRYDTQEPESFPSPDRSQNGDTINRSAEDVKSESVEFTVLHPNAICAHTTFSPETLTAKSYFLCGQRSFLGFEVSDTLL